MNIPDDTTNEVTLSSGIAAFEAKNFAQALALLGPLAERGEPDAQYRLAIMYQNGLGVVRNEILAMKWMVAAANQAFPMAQHGLGFMYLEGDCVGRNPDKAVEWFSRAAGQGMAGSCATLGMMYETGNGVTADPERARDWYRRAGFSDDELTLGEVVRQEG